MSASILSIPPLIDEAGAYARWGHILEDKELRHARAAGKLGHYKRKNKILYREDELVRFINERLNESYIPCQKPPISYSSSGDIGSDELPDQIASIDFGTMPELEKSAADLLRRPTSTRPRHSSQRSS